MFIIKIILKVLMFLPYKLSNTFVFPDGLNKLSGVNAIYSSVYEGFLSLLGVIIIEGASILMWYRSRTTISIILCVLEAYIMISIIIVILLSNWIRNILSDISIDIMIINYIKEYSCPDELKSKELSRLEKYRINATEDAIQKMYSINTISKFDMYWIKRKTTKTYRVMRFDVTRDLVDLEIKRIEHNAHLSKEGLDESNIFRH